MAPRALPRHLLEPAILRLQLELKIDRSMAEPVVQSGYVTSAHIAAADDEEFHARVPLPAPKRAQILALARTPGSKAPAAGSAPVSARDISIGPALLRGVAPVKRTVVRMLGETDRVAPAGPGAPKRPPPSGERGRAKRKSRRAQR